MKKLSLSLVVILMCYAFTYAQDKKDSEPNKNWEVGINAGVANFTGGYNMYSGSRFNHWNHWNNDLNFGFGAFVKKNFSHVFALEAGWNFNKLTGSWNELGTRPDFDTRTNEIDINTVWNVNNLFSKNKFDRKIYWYAKLGLGYTNLKNEVGMSLATSGPDWRKAAWKPTLDAGTGVAFRLNEKLRLNVGTQWSWLNTDRLDGKSEYPGITMKSGSDVPDVYESKLYTSVGLSYSFGKKKKPAPVVEAPKPEPQPEPKPEPKPEPAPAPAPAKPAVIGNIYKVYFAFDKFDLNNQSTQDLDNLAKDMNDNPSVMLDVQSHTDCRGPASYNMKLSEKRGKAVIDYLVSKGVSASRINAQAFGETQPVNKCVDGVPCTKAEHALNRRTVTTITE